MSKSLSSGVFVEVHVVHNSKHESIMHVGVNISRVEDRIVQHILNQNDQIPDNLYIHLLQFLKILKNSVRDGMSSASDEKIRAAEERSGQFIDEISLSSWIKLDNGSSGQCAASAPPLE
jgi:hypothetical protein